MLDRYKNMSLGEYLEEDESKFLEFKSSMLWDKGKQRCSDNKFLVLQIIMAIQSFLNSDGGILLVGVNPEKQIVGIQNDFNCLNKDKNFDGWSTYLTCKMRNWLDNLVFDSILVAQEKRNGLIAAKIIIEKHYEPVYIRYPDERGQQKVEFYIRGINGKAPLDTAQIHDYIKNHWYDTKQQENKEEREDRKTKLKEHCTKLAAEFLRAASVAYDNPRPTDPVQEGYAEFFTSLSRTFRLWKEFMQHLYTGYRDTHTSVDGALKLEQKRFESAYALHNKIQQAIRKEFGREVGFQSIVEQGRPTFNDEPFIWHLIEEVDLDKWPGLEADTEAGRRNIVSKNSKYQVDSVDKAFADNMVIRLNKVLSGSEIKAEILGYHNIRKSKEEYSNRATEQLGKLINGMRVGEQLDGACHICLKYHEKDFPQLQRLLSEQH